MKVGCFISVQLLAAANVTASLFALASPVLPQTPADKLPEAPGNSGKLGVDALLLAPVDKDKLVDQIETLLFPRAASSSGSHPTFPLGSQLLFNPPTPPPAAAATATITARKGRQKTDGGWRRTLLPL